MLTEAADVMLGIAAIGGGSLSGLVILVKRGKKIRYEKFSSAEKDRKIRELDNWRDKQIASAASGKELDDINAEYEDGLAAIEKGRRV